jgi:pSer/pThr/pTyr-binding forkhead associated (FHA) protein
MTATTTLPRLEIRGLGGLLAGARRRLERGETLVVGRSRTCDLSLRTTEAFERREDAARLLGSPAFNRVSRIHCEIAYRADGEIEVRDLSRNGTFVDGVRVGRTEVVRLRDGRATIELVDGTWGKLLLLRRGAARERADSEKPAATG